ncbi:MAG TPA: hypothetical protein VKB79_00045 [Bryobacteraceae bacterium]|nr:hypothetical protein [Bryobacteraceae bacterium]
MLRRVGTGPSGLSYPSQVAGELNERVREAIRLYLEVEGAPEQALEFVGIQRITIAA